MGLAEEPLKYEQPISDEAVAAFVAQRAVIEQAKGILMERYQLDADGAWAVLLRHSQHTNRKVRAIAEEFVRTGNLPDDPTGHLHSV